MGDWGWRVALGLGALVLPVGLIIRRTLPETLHHEEPRLDIHPEHDPAAGQLAAIAAHWRVVLIGVGVIAGATTQPIVAWLDHATGNPLAIAWYLMAGALVGLIAAIAMPETVRRPARS